MRWSRTWVSVVLTAGLVLGVGCPDDNDSGENDGTVSTDASDATVQDTSTGTDTVVPTDTSPTTATDTADPTDAVEDTTVATDAVEDTTVATDAVEDTVDDTSVEDTSVATDAVEDTSIDDTAVEDTTVATDAVEDTTTAMDTTADAGDTVVVTGDGDMCTDPIVVAVPADWTSDPTNAAPVVLSGSTLDATDTFNIGSGDCPGDDFASGFPERVYSLTAPVAGNYTVDLTFSEDIDLMLFAITDCGDPGGTCLGESDATPGPEQLSFAMGSGETILFVVDSWTSGDAGDYTITFTPPCVTSCVAGSCGDDGCGGTCGCESGEVCVAEMCEAAGAGDTCGTAFELTLVDGAASGNGDLTDGVAATQSYDRRDCSGTLDWGLTHPDQAWTFNASAGTWRVTATPSDPNGDLMLYSFADSMCDGTCVFTDDGGTGPVSEDIVVAADGTEVFFIVDSYDDEGEAPYTVSVCDATCRAAEGECGVTGCGDTCGCDAGETCNTSNNLCEGTPGDACDSARALTADGDGTFSGAGTLNVGAGLSPQYDAGTCPGVGFASGASYVDEAWRFSAPSAGDWEVRVIPTTPSTSFQLYAFPAAGCGTGCLARSNADLGAGEVERITLTASAADEIFFIVVDGTFSNPGAYTLEVGPPCVPDCSTNGECAVDDGCFGTCTCPTATDICDTSGSTNVCADPALIPGNTCSKPFVVELPEPFDTALTLTGNTTDATNALDVATSASCPGLGFASVGRKDEIYQFEAPSDGVYTFTLDPDVDLMLYVLDTCADPTNACVAGSDNAGSGPTGNEVISVPMVADEIIFLVVDAWTSGSAGAYTLAISPPCTPAGAGEECDECGCVDGYICDTTGAVSSCELPSAGDTCENAIELTGDATNGYTGTGSIAAATTTLTPVYNAGTCPNVSSTSGAASPDEVFTFAPEPDRTWRVRIGATSDVQVYAFADPDDSDTDTTCGAGCVARADGGNPETIRLDSTGVERFFIVVDAFGASGAAGTYTVDVCDATCPVGSCGSMNACGEMCGCPTGETCNAGTCEATPGDSCAAPFTLDVASGTATGAGSLVPTGASALYRRGSCEPSTSSPTWGGAYPDQVWEVEGIYAGDWRVTVTPSMATGQDFMLYSYVGVACGVASAGCDFEDDGSSGPVSVDLTVADGEELYLIVDAYAAGAQAAYTIEVTELITCEDDLMVPTPQDADLVISEIAPGEHVEVFNPTDTDIVLNGSSYELCEPFVYADLSAAGVGEDVVVPAFGFAVLGWPAAFSAASDSAGEIVLYRDGSHNNDDSILDYVCWGPDPTGGRFNQALNAGKWQGACAFQGGLANGAIHREVGTTGTEAAHYRDAAPSPQDCVPAP